MRNIEAIKDSERTAIMSAIRGGFGVAGILNQGRHLASTDEIITAYEAALSEAETRLTASHAREAELREALRPFVWEAERLGRDGYDDAQHYKDNRLLSTTATGNTIMTYGDFRRARSVYEQRAPLPQEEPHG